MDSSYNGWSASKTSRDIGGLDNRAIDGVTMAPGVRSGDVATVLFYVAHQFHLRVEKLVPGWCWGFSYRQNRNAANLSCHASGTAIDLNAPRHPNGKRGTFTAAQVAEIRTILAEVQKVVRWGGDFTGTADEMHFEIVAAPATVGLVADRLNLKSPVNPPTAGLPIEELDMSAVDTLAALINGFGRRTENIERMVIGYGQRTENTEKMVSTVADRQVGYGRRIEDTQARVAALQAVVAAQQGLTPQQLEDAMAAAIAKSVVKVDVSVGTSPLSTAQVAQAVEQQTSAVTPA